MVLEILTGLFKTFATYLRSIWLDAFCICSQLSGMCHVSCESSLVNFWGKCFCICFGVYGETDSSKQVSKGCGNERLSVRTSWLICLLSNLHKITWKLVSVSFMDDFKMNLILLWNLGNLEYFLKHLLWFHRLWASYNSHRFPSANKAPIYQLDTFSKELQNEECYKGALNLNRERTFS